MYTNIRGIKGKQSSLTEHLHSENPEVFLLTETLLPLNINIHISGYTFFGRARQGKKGGGIGMLVRDDIKGSVIPHVSERNIEMMWLSVRRKGGQPFFIGCYYGKQESRCKKDEIDEEIQLLSEEIEEYRNEGNVIIFMDGNGKIGILGEPKSRNGLLLEQVFENHNLIILNKSNKCIGKVTRQNTKNNSEKSAIDFVVTDSEIIKWIKSMKIDEDGLLKISGKNDTDHNTIVVDLTISKFEKTKPAPNIQWRLHAPQTNWVKFRHELCRLEPEIKAIFQNHEIPVETMYSRWIKKMDAVARISIGKTTLKANKCEKFSVEIDELRRCKREIKGKLKSPNTDKDMMFNEFRSIQESLKTKILEERINRMNFRLRKMTKDKSKVIFWKERKKVMRNKVDENPTVKDDTGTRVYHPDQIKEVMASYYENLYSKKEIRPHPHHEIVRVENQSFLADKNNENEWYNQPPSTQEILEIIRRKKNGKSSTDYRNEMIKLTESEIIKNFMPLVNKIWEQEKVPKEWNTGSITSLYKGKGDRESLKNHRGITVSSSFGKILEEVIDKRMEKIVPFTQGQAGGRKGASTADHLFLIRGIATISIKNKQNVFLTFFDVAKAYDNADVENMLNVMWKAGVQGKLWRLLKVISSNLTATVKTQYGQTRQIIRENGGLQGSSITGRCFSKQMDGLSEESINVHEEKLVINDHLSIGCLEFVDDVASVTCGIKNQLSILNKIDEFAMKNKLEWGESKCKVMQVGRKTKIPEHWKLGEKLIGNTKSYKYLGDILTDDNKNKQNLISRENRLNATTRQINATASSEVMRGIETKAILELYEKCILTSFLFNAESWTLTLTEERQIDKTLIQAIKRLFGLPTTTPSAAVVFSFGLLYATQIVDQKKFLFLHKILSREDNHWTKLMLLHLQSIEAGWAKQTANKLCEYGLETDWNAIKRKTKGQWTTEVRDAVETFNKNKLIQNCTTTESDGLRINSKTRYIHTTLTTTTNPRRPLPETTNLNKQRTRTLIFARTRMLQCGQNYKGTMSDTCEQCQSLDDESHRLNDCMKWQEINNYSSVTKPNFNNIFSEDTSVLSHIIEQIEKTWDMRFTNGKMKI